MRFFIFLVSVVSSSSLLAHYRLSEDDFAQDSILTTMSAIATKVLGRLEYNPDMMEVWGGGISEQITEKLSDMHPRYNFFVSTTIVPRVTEAGFTTQNSSMVFPTRDTFINQVKLEFPTMWCTVVLHGYSQDNHHPAS